MELTSEEEGNLMISEEDQAFYDQRQAVLEAPDEDDVEGEGDEETDTRVAKKPKRKQDGGGLDGVLVERAGVERGPGKRAATAARGK